MTSSGRILLAVKHTKIQAETLIQDVVVNSGGFGLLWAPVVSVGWFSIVNYANGLCTLFC